MWHPYPSQSFVELCCICLVLSLTWLGIHGQSYYYGNQNTGVRETLVGINAYCDFTCSNAQVSNRVSYCLQNGFMMNSPISQVLSSCTAQMGYTISCNQNSLMQLENCVNRMVNGGYQTLPSPQVTRCLRQVLVPQVTSCLRMRYPRLNRYLPFVGPYFSMGGGYGNGYGYSSYG